MNLGVSRSGRTTSTPESTRGATGRRFTGRFAYLRRGSWGADESYRFDETGRERVPAAFTPVQTLTVHHTATADADPNPVATVRALLREHAATRGLGDLGYHLLIDHRGGVYEGRWSGPSGLVPGPTTVTGAHVDGFDPGNIGVALLGDLSASDPTPDARAALVRVLATLIHATELDPVGRTTYVHPQTGATRAVPVIAVAANWTDDDLAGSIAPGLLTDLRAEVAALLLG